MTFAFTSNDFHILWVCHLRGQYWPNIQTRYNFLPMPHIILSGSTNLRSAFDQFESHRADSNDWIIKIKNCLICGDATLLLFDCTAVRSGFSQDFYIRVESKADRLTVRVDPYMKIERNEGVQRTIASIAKELRGTLPLDKSNLPPEILKEFSFSS